jgi:hypothetical protein
MRVHTGYLRSNSLGPETTDSKIKQLKTEDKCEATSNSNTDTKDQGSLRVI